MVNQEPNKHIIGTKALVENTVHFGHKKFKRNPKMNSYIYAKKGNFHIINLSKTLDKITEAYLFLKDQASKEGFQMIFVGTKPKAKKIIAEESIRCGESFINERWLGGTLTNSKTINKRLQTWSFLESQEKNGAFNLLTKKEALIKSKEIERLSKFFRGIRGLNGFPKVLFIVDIEKEKTALLEAKAYNIPVIAIVNTNVDPSLVTYPIPANDENEKSINIIVSLMADAVIEGKNSNAENFDISQLKFAYNKESFEPVPKRVPVEGEKPFNRYNKNRYANNDRNESKPYNKFSGTGSINKPYRSRFEAKMLGNINNNYAPTQDHIAKDNNLDNALNKSVHIPTAQIPAQNRPVQAKNVANYAPTQDHIAKDNNLDNALNKSVHIPTAQIPGHVSAAKNADASQNSSSKQFTPQFHDFVEIENSPNVAPINANVDLFKSEIKEESKMKDDEIIVKQTKVVPAEGNNNQSEAFVEATDKLKVENKIALKNQKKFSHVKNSGEKVQQAVLEDVELKTENDAIKKIIEQTPSDVETKKIISKQYKDKIIDDNE